MGINIRAKGQNGEREVAETLNMIIKSAMRELDMPVPTDDIVQRNQNQSAVGGNDLSNTFGASIEVKRHETLSINTWWKQCLAAAERNNEIPVLIFRQNRAAWRVIMFGWIEIAKGKQIAARVETDWETFKLWYYNFVMEKLKAGELPRL